MSKLMVVMIEVVGICSYFGGVVAYAQDSNRYTGRPYYLEHGFESTSPIESSSSPQALALQSPNAKFGFGGFDPPMPNFGIGFGAPSYGPYDGGSPGQSYGQGAYDAGPPAPYGPSGPPPFGYPDPGFQTQTGFEGLLVPNSWYGLLPWGIEGVIIVIAGIIVFAIVVIAIIGLLAWLCGIKTVIPLSIIKGAEDGEVRSRFGDQWGESLMDLSATVIDAIEKFNEVVPMSEEEEKFL